MRRQRKSREQKQHDKLILLLTALINLIAALVNLVSKMQD